MTEAKWLAATDPRAMFDWLCLSGHADHRRIGLLLGACCNLIPPSVVEAPDQSQLGAHGPDDDDDPVALTDAEYYLSSALLEAMRLIPGGEGEQATLTSVIRDIFGNPFRPPLRLSAEWRTGTVMSLARQIREIGDFAALPILADALEEAGCTDEVLLGHCRGPGPHVRGCWAVEFVLGFV